MFTLQMGLLTRLQALEREGRPIRVAVIGAGQMGAGLCRRFGRLPGFALVGACDVVPARAAEVLASAGVPGDVAEHGAEARRLVRERRAVATTRAEVLLDLPEVDAVVDATGDPDAGARLALAATGRRKAMITLNVEAEVTVGPVLAWTARAAGLVHTLAAGDEPAVLADLVEFARLVGLEVVCAGKGKNNRFDRTATAASVALEAAQRGMSPRMLAAFVDGTKTMAELAVLANATGLVPDRPGLHGPRADLADLLRVFVPVADGGILQRSGVVDFALGDVAPGVFVVGRAEDAALARDLSYLRMGAGPYYLLYRPYHLASLEAPLAVARAVLFGDVTLAAAGAPVAECAAAAKRDLRPGDVLDGIGGTTVYGVTLAADEARAHDAVPVGVTAGARVRRAVARDALLTASDVDLEESLAVVHLRRLQDALVRDGTLAPVAAGSGRLPARAGFA
ncbi:MAG: SAF domain-containing protein [Armatimonadota bacterium]|nr:SAF domain-containing protein [Armatimonadota bacterium]MDR7485105.1 SAF domain-containing protein [Armatimonadota bacterium]MDR7533493.1 SAF domain-containing protein [Armatimonadota bacterium]MDR7537006.1 SAF domain-containing protein [Armatimonadota bacterium]